MNLADLPNPPRQQFAMLHGKRPDLMLTPERGNLVTGCSDAQKDTSPFIWGIWGNGKSLPFIIMVGGAN